MNMMFKLVITFQDLYGSSSYLQIFEPLKASDFPDTKYCSQWFKASIQSKFDVEF